MSASKRKQTSRRATSQSAKALSASTNLADALFTTTQQRVLALLFGQPNRSFFATELFALIGSGRGAVQRELRRLADSGLVTVQKAGRQKHYQANSESPVFEELCSIVRKTVGFAESLRAALVQLEGRIGLAILYGSVAKHTDTAKSDIDLLIIADDLTLEELYTVLVPVEDRLGRKINPTLYTTKEFEQRRRTGNPFLTKVLTDKHMVLVGDEHGASRAG